MQTKNSLDSPEGKEIFRGVEGGGHWIYIHFSVHTSVINVNHVLVLNKKDHVPSTESKRSPNAESYTHISVKVNVT